MDVSPSESLGKAVLVVVTRINENDLRKGNPNQNEPDFILMNSNLGFEITFASNREDNSKSSILRLRKSGYNVRNGEIDLIKSISYSINEKAKKKNKGNYKNVDGVSVLIISLDPLLIWYGDLHNFNHPFTLVKRDEFFKSLYIDYIQNSIFKNIFILQLTEFQTYVLFNIKNINENFGECITEIGSTNLNKLPHCIITNKSRIDGSIINGDPLIIYKYRNFFLERKKTHNNPIIRY